MEYIFLLLLLASLVLLVIGFFKPSTSLFWDKKPTKKKSALIYSGLTILSFILIGVTIDKTELSKNKSTDGQTTTVESNKEGELKISELTQAQKDSITKREHDAELAEISKNTISANALTSRYEANEVAADNEFKGKTFYVSGTVTDIKKDILDDIYVILKGGEMFRDVQCYFEDAETAGQLQKGMRVTFKGECDGLMMNVLMKDCVLIK